jgi:hypothetical protein
MNRAIAITLKKCGNNRPPTEIDFSIVTLIVTNKGEFHVMLLALTVPIRIFLQPIP